ncbi:MAG TPA: PaaI family thioesterase, partial [Caldimonas sp.]
MSFPSRIPFVESLGFEFVRWHAGEAEIAVTLRDELCNAWSVVHGGVTMTLLDVVMAHAARSPGQAGIAEPRG